MRLPYPASNQSVQVRLNVLACWHSLRRLERLTLIGLSFTAADAHHLTVFLQAGAASSLTSLVLGDQQGLNFLSDAALEGLGRLLGPAGKLRVLDLSGCIELTDAGVRHLAGLSSLQSLQLPNAMKIGVGAVTEVAKFTALQHLNLRGCSQLQDSHLLQLLRRLTCLQTLNLQSCSGLTGSFLPEVCSALVNLKTLNLAYCPGLYPGQLSYLSVLPALEQLDVTGGSAVSGVEALLLLVLAGFSGLSSLRSLSIISCQGFSGSGFSTWGGLQELTRLNLSGCGGVCDAGVAALARECKGLRELLLAGCRAVGDEGVRELRALRRLRRLNLTSNKNITHRSLAALLPGLRHLCHLTLDLCTGLGDAALPCLAAAPGLATADMRGCWQVTDEETTAKVQI
ncbi:hypothetical protein OEZ85_008980 [Tetradesmus obliquus]|uniref:Uncharacterized protein n=1 Tax=Tetradesmus obliquus TaxID=3088 RepID=A0ABY8TQ32_TETOB|nr:hypothetical protein OEZ85_008980 [Tetradesmus obliquus]